MDRRAESVARGEAMERRAAVARAKAAMSLSGHPEVTWSVVLEARLAGPADAAGVPARLAQALEPLPVLGPVPSVVRVNPEELDGARRLLANAPYENDGPVMRVAMADGSPSAILVAAHHGALDGLGLLALLGVVLGSPVSSSAHGLGDRPAAGSFTRVAVQRLAEAAFRPPTRIAPARGARAMGARDEVGDELVAADVLAEVGTAALVVAAVRAVRRWNERRGARTDRLVVAVGASRRAGGSLRMEERSAYLRLRVAGIADEAHVRDSLRRAPSQPAAPAARGLGAVAPLARAASRRLGSTLLVSHLGTVSGPAELRSVAFYPVSHGRSGVAVGAARVGGTTTLTLRARRGDFDRAAAEALLAALAEEVSPGSPGRSGTS